MPPRTMSVIERFWSKVDIRCINDCWFWTKGINNSGYGSYTIDSKKSMLAHRMAWQSTYGDIPSGVEVCHKCGNKICVNPRHLYLASHKLNMGELLIRRLKKKSDNGILECPTCHQIIDEAQQVIIMGAKCE